MKIGANVKNPVYVLKDNAYNRKAIVTAQKHVVTNAKFEQAGDITVVRAKFAHIEQQQMFIPYTFIATAGQPFMPIFYITRNDSVWEIEQDWQNSKQAICLRSWADDKKYQFWAQMKWQSGKWLRAQQSFPYHIAYQHKIAMHLNDTTVSPFELGNSLLIAALTAIDPNKVGFRTRYPHEVREMLGANAPF